MRNLWTVTAMLLLSAGLVSCDGQSGGADGASIDSIVVKRVACVQDREDRRIRLTMTLEGRAGDGGSTPLFAVDPPGVQQLLNLFSSSAPVAPSPLATTVEADGARKTFDLSPETDGQTRLMLKRINRIPQEVIIRGATYTREIDAYASADPQFPFPPVVPVPGPAEFAVHPIGCYEGDIPSVLGGLPAIPPGAETPPPAIP
ncbi:MAG: hypothetical protein WD004_08180 [Actinomycetota bacterium]